MTIGWSIGLNRANDSAGRSNARALVGASLETERRAVVKATTFDPGVKATAPASMGFGLGGKS